ncbi:MAG TPA: PKD domain-containing protein [Herpetosiphonaceae bacterium]
MSAATTVTVGNVAPTAGFTTPSQVSEGSPIVIQLSKPADPSSVDRAAGFSYAFDCGSGYGSASSSASISCPTSDNGVRTVRARVSDKDGGTTEYSALVTINNVAPTASFTASTPVNEGSPIVLALSNPSDPSSVDTANGFSYAFDCGSGYSSASGTASFSCPTTDNGVRTVKAKISDKNGGVTEYTATSNILNVAPTATFTASSQVNEGQPINLALTNPQDPSSSDTTAGFSYAFDCASGYGTASSAASTSCATNDNEVRTVKAKISDKDGGFTEYTATSTVRNVPPTATFSAPSLVDEGDGFTLTLSNPSDPSNVDTAGGFSYAFDCGSGYGTASNSPTASCTTNDNGVRTVKAKISDKDGGTTEYSAQVTINNIAPIASFIVPSFVDEGDGFMLRLSNPSDPSSVDTAAGFSYAFDCGSGYGTASSTATANCTTNDNGARTVKAKIRDKNGGTTEYVAEVTINNVAPIATFTSPSQVDEGSPIVLTLSNPSDPSSVDTANGFSYAFDCGSGYGTASSTPTVSCPTTDNGVRTVKARIGDKDGDTTEYNAQVTINNVAPIATFTTTAPVNEGDPFVLALSAPSDPSSVDTAAGFSYAFDCGSGYGTASSTPTASCATDDNEVRTVKAKIRDKDGGFTEYTATSTIDNVAPTASFTASSQVNEGSPINLALTNPQDPSSSDTTAGFSYAFDCGSGYGTASSTATASCPTTDNGLRTVKAKISDKDGDFTEYTATSTIDNVAPIASFTAPSSLDEGSGFMLRLSNPSDPSSVDTAAGFSYAFDCGSGYASASSTPTANCTTNDNQVRTVKAKISDKDGGTTEYVAEVTINNVAPVATFTASSPVNEGSPIVLTLSAPSDPSSVDTAAGFSYAFDCGNGYGATSSTATASCTTNDNGLRTVRAKISDKDGGTTEYSAQVTINNVAPVVGPITAPTTSVAMNTTINVSAPFSDPGTADTHTAVIDWGNNTTSAGTVTYNPATGTGTVQASYAYPAPGIYTVKITVTDDDGDSGSALFRYVVVYDPNLQGNAVHGRAKFTSPVGAYVANPTLTGDATAGLNGNYSNLPPTTLVFSLGNLMFSSTAYDWIVVVGAKGQYQGSGTINGQGNYGFMVAVIDGALKGDGNAPDMMRIRIWDKNNGNAVVYDTQMGAAFDADPTLVVDQGSNITVKK